ncbi:NADH:ubiquinone reductase (Na(+)-transporting) subunit C [Psittacicella melopsittaci]|uniref:Na(+)-translocating NADH-quinone reductase subunit C n=1 Tax=Psittacicella melopsittaci TaxID=2028576 RepID=A0A3A1Y6Y7_9GAMM|nr:NADH:ubiquinone reductase (Na(+)-transporting) subunit C [Psittacicella melopsittaci]RIY33050.1 NADH:ubiquinone reductase (Na(+)-transporting) subunit C [Psittacicella melopsittaci]
MALNKNSTLYVSGFVALVSIVCAFIVAAAATGLANKQNEQIAANTQRFVLKVSDIEFTEPTLQQIFTKDIDVRYVDRLTGNFINPPEDVKADYDNLLVLSKFDSYVGDIPASANIAGLKNNKVANVLKIYLVKNEQTGAIDKIILPFYGNGLWSVMYGFLAVDAKDANTITGITYYQHGETPGLGGEVDNPRFTAQFVGKKIYDLNGNNGNPSDPKINLVKIISPAEQDYQVNALTGATLTSNGVAAQLHFWLSDYGYAKFLEKVRTGEVNLNGGQ